MKRKIALLTALVFLFSALFITTVSAGNHHGKKNKSERLYICGNYYTEDGYRAYSPNVRYDGDGNAVFGENCYYYDADGKKISAYGEAAFYYGEDGVLCAGVCGYCYTGNGDRTACPSYNVKSADKGCHGNGKK